MVVLWARVFQKLQTLPSHFHFLNQKEYSIAPHVMGKILFIHVLSFKLCDLDLDFPKYPLLFFTPPCLTLCTFTVYFYPHPTPHK